MEVKPTANASKFDVVFANQDELTTFAGHGFIMPSLQGLRTAWYATRENEHYPSTITYKAKHLEAAAEELEYNADLADDEDRAEELRNMASLITGSLLAPEDQPEDL